jgi:hypothetical protein
MEEKVRIRIQELEKEKVQYSTIASCLSYRQNFQEKINMLNKIEVINSNLNELHALLKSE